MSGGNVVMRGGSDVEDGDTRNRDRAERLVLGAQEGHAYYRKRDKLEANMVPSINGRAIRLAFLTGLPSVGNPEMPQPFAEKKLQKCFLCSP